MSAERYGSNATTDSPSRTDRRRAGSRIAANAALIPLVRGQDRFTRHELQLDSGRDPLSTARGVAFSLLVCGAFWAGVAFLF